MSGQDRVGFAFIPSDARSGLDLIARAEAAGVPAAWVVMPALGRDSLTLLGAAAVKTERIALGTAIVPAFTRHPIALATQMLTLEDLAPGRFRLGIGTAHQRTMIPAFGLPFERPLAQLREYIAILRPALETGEVDFTGEFYRATAKLAYAPKTPLLMSALRSHAFAMAGELADGAISWLCPLSYLTAIAKPALEQGARQAGRTAPPLIAHVLVSPGRDRTAVVAAARAQLAYYAAAPFYRAMFADAGFPLGPDFAIPDALVDALVVSGEPAAIVAGLHGRLARGVDELIVSLVNSDTPLDDATAVLSVLGRMAAG